MHTRLCVHCHVMKILVVTSLHIITCNVYILNMQQNSVTGAKNTYTSSLVPLFCEEETVSMYTISVAKMFQSFSVFRFFFSFDTAYTTVHSQKESVSSPHYGECTSLETLNNSR